MTGWRQNIWDVLFKKKKGHRIFRLQSNHLTTVQNIIISSSNTSCCTISAHSCFKLVSTVPARQRPTQWFSLKLRWRKVWKLLLLELPSYSVDCVVASTASGHVGGPESLRSRCNIVAVVGAWPIISCVFFMLSLRICCLSGWVHCFGKTGLTPSVTMLKSVNWMFPWQTSCCASGDAVNLKRLFVLLL